MEYFVFKKIGILLHCIKVLLFIFFSFNNLFATGIKSNNSQVQSSIHNSGTSVLRTKKLTIDDGLSTSGIKAITQDHTGYIWIGTPSNLNRYDGHSIKTYLSTPESKSSLSNNFINDLLVAHTGRSWIATNQGLNRLNQEDDAFIVYKHDRTNPQSANNNAITSEEWSLPFNKSAHPLLSLWAISIYVFFLMVAILLYLTQQRRQLAILTDIATRESNLSKELRQLSKHLQNAREEERASVARELHDELAQILVAIKLEISWIQSTLEKNSPEKVISRMPEVISVVDNCVSSVRNIATGLRPKILDDMGLIPALDWYSKSVCERSKINREFSSNCDSICLSKELSINIYRIVQETVTNVIKHARADTVSISCLLIGQDFHLTVKDNGIGLNDTDIGKTGHYGLIGVRERVESYNGRVVINANKPTGLVIDITLPVVDDIMQD